MARIAHIRNLAQALRMALALAWLPWLAGCAASGGGLTLFPLDHRLSPAAEQLRAQRPRPVAAPRELDKAVATELRVEPGDALGFALAEPVEGLDLPPDQPVLADGTIDLGSFGRLVVAYRSLAEIEQLVGDSVTLQWRARQREARAQAAAERLKKDPKAKPLPEEPVGPPVRVVARFAPRPASKVVYVFGEVASPGAFNWEGRETVLDAIVAAGGLTRSADHHGIVLARPSGACDARTVLPICYDHIVQLGDTTTNYQLLAGDRIFVPGLSLRERLFKKHRRQPGPPCCDPQHPANLPTLDCGPCPSYGAPRGFAAPGAQPAVAVPPLVEVPPPAPEPPPKPKAEDPKDKAEPAKLPPEKKPAKDAAKKEPPLIPTSVHEAPVVPPTPIPSASALPRLDLPPKNSAARDAARTAALQAAALPDVRIPGPLSEIRALPPAPRPAKPIDRLGDSAFRLDYNPR